VPTAPPDPGSRLFGFDLPGWDYSIGGTEFVFDWDTVFDRVNPFNGGEGLADAGAAAGDMAGAAGEAATESFLAAIEPWVGRVVAILIALIFIAGGIALLSSGRPLQVAKEALA